MPMYAPPPNFGRPPPTQSTTTTDPGFGQPNEADSPPPGIDPGVWAKLTGEQRAQIWASVHKGNDPTVAYQQTTGEFLPTDAGAAMGLVPNAPTDQVFTGPNAVANPINPADTTGRAGADPSLPPAPPSGGPTGDFGAGLEYDPVKRQAQELYNQSQELARLGMTWNPNTQIRDVSDITPDVVRSRDVTIGPLAPVQGVTAPTIGPAAQVGPTTVQRTDFDTGRSDEIRARELANVQALEDQAAGRTPTASGALMDAALARIASEQLGAVGTARGSQRAGALLQANRLIGQQGVQAAADKAALAIQEQQQNRAALTGALAGVRGQDVNIAAKAADLRAQANNLEAQIRSAEAQGNRDAVNALKSQQAALQLQADSLTAQMTNSRTETEAALRAQTEGLNANRGLAADTTNAANKLQAAETLNAQRLARDQAALSGEQQTFAIKGQTTAAGLGAGTAATNTAGTAAQGIVGARQTAGAQDIARTAAGGAAGGSKGFDWGGLLGGIGGGIVGGFTTGPAGIAPGAIGGYKTFHEEDKSLFPSDERVKQDIRDVSPAELRQLADHLDAATFRYKPGEGPPGTHAGPMAQDLEQSRLGALAVHQDTRGFKQVDPQELTRLALLMSAAALRSQRRAA